ncbi:alpha/beta hydrolase family protein [Xanthobacter agilis]|uniref:Poly(3-hydroxybutyrate) depolymerase n=1 Tax=Xanthobacter agilis TaxID=47492 RepID=A0ABU0L9J9_XANAG|nr:hypothetical protein [Xanthobacter agilis]MDQ0503813.1 poly(3-hydroxybutyrate) depolymerase [Xanthobacter agilis]
MWLDDHRPLAPGAPAPDRCLDEDAFRPFGIDHISTTTTDFAVSDTVRAHLPYGMLRSFKRTGEGAPPPTGRRVLVVSPLAGGFPFLMRDLVVSLLAIADEVAITDWPDARYVPVSAGPFSFVDNCIETAQMIRALSEEAGSTHVVGVCQGSVPALVGAALLAQAGLAPASLTLIGGPIDPSRNPTRLWRMLQGRTLEALERQVIEPVAERFPGAGRLVFPAWRQTDTFALYLWRQSMTGGRLPLQLAFDEGDDPFRFPLARLCWTLMDVPGEFFIENVATIFQANALVQGTLEVAGHRVDPAALRQTALLTVEGAEDDISALCQTEAAHDLCPNIPEAKRARLVVPKAGHFALFYGRAMRAQVIPAVSHIMAAAEGG